MRLHSSYAQLCALFTALCAFLTLQKCDVYAFENLKEHANGSFTFPPSPVDQEAIAKMKLLDAINRQRANAKKGKDQEGEGETAAAEPAGGKSPKGDDSLGAIFQSTIPKDDAAPAAGRRRKSQSHAEPGNRHRRDSTSDSDGEGETMGDVTTMTDNVTDQFADFYSQDDQMGQGGINGDGDNMAALEQSIGAEVFGKAFLESLDPSVRRSLLSQAPNTYVATYMRYAQRLQNLETQSFKKTVRLVETKNDSLGFIDFSEKRSGNLLPEVNKEALKMAGVTSMLELGHTPRVRPGMPNTTPKTVPAGIVRKPPTRVEGKDTPVLQKPWTENTKVLEALTVKVIYLLGGDTQTADDGQRLKNMAEALGYKGNHDTDGKKKKRRFASKRPFAVDVGMEMFTVCGNNPFLLGHLAVNMLAYNEFESFFVKQSGRPFYTWLDLLKSGSIDMLDSMCGTKRGSKYKKNSTGKLVTNKNRAGVRDPTLKPDSVFLCNLLEVLMISINNAMNSMGVLLAKYGMPYEPNIGLVENGDRMQLALCSDPRDGAVTIRCDFKSSLLAKHKTYEGMSKTESTELYRRLHEAFDLFKLFSDLASDDGIPQTWMKILSDPRRYESVFEHALKYDGRKFSGKSKSWLNGYTNNEISVLGEIDASGNIHEDVVFETLRNKERMRRDGRGLLRPFMYMSSTGIKHWVNKNMAMLQERFGFSPSVILSGELAPYFRQVYMSTSSGLSHIFLYYMLTTSAPGNHLLGQMKSFRGGNLIYNIVESSSMFIPKSLKRGLKWLLRGGLGREYKREKSKHALLKLLPTELLKKAIGAITFVTHSLADIQINQNAEIWGNGLLSGTDRQRMHFQRGGYVNHVDDIIRKWSDEGYTDAMASKIRNGEDLTKEDLDNANIHKILHHESLKWDKNLNSVILEGYIRFLKLPSISVLEGKNSLLYEVVNDSKANLEQNLQETVFFGRVIPPPVYNNKLKRALQRAAKVGKMLFNKSLQNVEHAVWFGVKFNYQHIIEVVEELNKISTLLSSTESYSLQEAFGHIIDDALAVVSNQEFRIPQDAQENIGIPAINPLYTRMSPEERKVEFQQGMCGQHCGAIWRALLAFTMNTMRSPASIKTFERTLSKKKSLKDMEKPEFVNSLRFILKGDAMMHMYDSMLPKKMKKELRAIKYGKAFYFANVMKLASRLLDLMNYKYTSHMLYIQAPYFGNFVVQWDREREKSKSKAIFSYLSLGAMATYSIMQCAEITQHASEVGLGPVQKCFTMLKPPKVHCVAQEVQSVATSALSVGVQDTLSVTVMAVIGPYIFLPMAVRASWQILKHHFKIIHRLDLAVSATFRRMWNKITSTSIAGKVTEWFAKRKEHRKNIEAEGELAMKAGKAADDADILGGNAIYDELLRDEDNSSYTTIG